MYGDFNVIRFLVERRNCPRIYSYEILSRIYGGAVPDRLIDLPLNGVLLLGVGC